MKKRVLLDINDTVLTAKVTRALASEARLKILQVLTSRTCNITELAELFDLPVSTIANHIHVLEDAELIHSTERPGVRGSQKMCQVAFEDVYISNIIHEEESKEKSYFVPMSIGNYFDFEATAPCGMASENSYIGIEDEVSVFYSNERSDAQLIWFHTGFLEYRFPLESYPSQRIKALKFTLEVCSEAPGYNHQWPSDIEVKIDGEDCATIHSQGDFGGARGALNPQWWPNFKTQYGVMHQLEIQEEGTYLDGVKCGELSIEDIDTKKKFVSFRLEVPKNAQYVGGINLFGEQFGNHAQGLQMEVVTTVEQTKR